MILRGLKGHYEKVHGVSVRDDAVVAAADCRIATSPGACCRTRPSTCSTLPAPGYASAWASSLPSWSAWSGSLSGLAREQSALERDRGNGFPVEDQRLTDIADEQAEIDERRVALEVRWLAERDAALRVLEARKQLTLQAQDLPVPAEGEVVQVLASLEERQAELDQARETLTALQGDAPLLFTEVSPDAIAQVVSDWTGVTGQSAARCGGRRIGPGRQPQDAHSRSETPPSSRSRKSSRPRNPACAIRNSRWVCSCWSGRRGSAKTETALAVAEHLFGGEQAMISVNIERVSGEAHRQPLGGFARRLCRLRRGRHVDRGGAQASVFGGVAR